RAARHRRGARVAGSNGLNGGGRMQQTLDLGVIGNGSFGALVDREARVVWSCLPAFDGDPAFCALLSPREHEGGDLAVELEDYERSERSEEHTSELQSREKLVCR